MTVLQKKAGEPHSGLQSLVNTSSPRPTGDRERHARKVAETVLTTFNDYYRESRLIPHLAKSAFEKRDWPEMVSLSRRRLAIYASEVHALAPLLRAEYPDLQHDEAFWKLVEASYLPLIAGRYEADLAFAFLYSIRRIVFQDVWKPVSYAPGDDAPGLREPTSVLTSLAAAIPVRSSDVRTIFAIAGFRCGWRDEAGDARLVGLEITRTLLRRGFADGEAVTIEMVNAGFYRNRGACLVGRIKAEGRPAVPLLIAFLNGRDGAFADAVLFESDELQYAFSSTLANFHVTSPHYHELAAFLHELMPKRPIGKHYSTIGFNHVGKVAVMNEIADEHARTSEAFDTAAGFRGTVAIGFSMPSSRYVLKIIRDAPTEGYKWGTFAGVKAVLDKYRFVHEADRAGSMLDNIVYTNVSLDRDMFAPALLDELLDAGRSNVTLHEGKALFRHLIVQMKMIPLPIFLETASPEQARQAVLNLGDCIKNNAAANIFNKDLDGRNYGVSPITRVYLFDYDAVEPLTDVKVRTNSDREDGEEDVPDWFFEEGTVFLPEEMLAGLRIEDPALRRAFREAHPELMSVPYWHGMQRALKEGKVPKVRSYPISRRLHRHGLRFLGPAGASAG